MCKKYYLETSALRKLSKRLTDRDFCGQCYTSILSISELLSGIKDENEFTLRKSILKKINSSEIEINLYYPEISRMKAFGFNYSFTESDSIIRISKILVEADSFVTFLNKLSNFGLTQSWNFLKKYDHNGDFEFKTALRQRASENPKDPKQAISEFNELWDNFNISTKSQYINDTIHYYAQQTLEINSTKSLQELLNSYDHTLNKLFLATYLYSGDKISFKNEAGKNDYFDLTHLSYLTNENKIIVTDDKLIHGLMNKLLYKKNICFVNEI